MAAAKLGFAAVPHLAARLVEGRQHLEHILTTLDRSGVGELFVIGGDGEPRGIFTDTLDLLEAMGASWIRRFEIGVAGYPETHPLVDRAVLDHALLAKQPMASYVVTQMCFDTAAIDSWTRHIRSAGLNIPILLGVPGRVAVTRLLAIAVRIGVGPSLRLLRRHRGILGRLASPRYDPGDLARELAPLLVEEQGASGFHIYTLNDVEATEQWRRSLLDRLIAAGRQ